MPRVKSSPVETVKDIIACTVLIIIGIGLFRLAYLVFYFIWQVVRLALEWLSTHWFV